MASDSDTTNLILFTGVVGLLFAYYLMRQVSQVRLNISESGERELDSLVEKGAKGDRAWEQTERLHELYEAIRLGANSFLHAEYKMCAYFVLITAPLVGVLIARGADDGPLTPTQSGTMSAVSFTVGALTSMFSGYIGMKVAVYSNARCTVGAIKTGPQVWTDSFNTAFRAGGVMGFSLCGIALLCMYGLICAYASRLDYSAKNKATHLMDMIAG